MFGLLVLQLLSTVTHPWVNAYMQVVGHPDLHGWDGTNPPLIGDIVAAVIQEFARNSGSVNSSGHDQATASWGGPRVMPPMGFSAAQPASGGFGLGNPHVNPSASGLAGAGAGAQERADVAGPTQRREAQPRKPRQKHQTHIPAIPFTFSELQGLSTEKLNRLLGDESARQALLLGMASVVQMKDLRTDVRKGNVETARQIMAKQDTVSALRNEGETMKAELKGLQTSYEGWPTTRTFM